MGLGTPSKHLHINAKQQDGSREATAMTHQSMQRVSERACLLALDILYVGKQVRKDAWNQPGLQKT